MDRIDCSRVRQAAGGTVGYCAGSKLEQLEPRVLLSDGPGPFTIGPMADVAFDARNADQVRFVLENELSKPVLFEQSSAGLPWQKTDLTNFAGLPTLSEAVTWIDVEDELTRVAGLSDQGVLLLRRDADQRWSQRNLTADLGGSAIERSLRMMRSGDGRVDLIGLGGDGDLLRYTLVRAAPAADPDRDMAPDADPPVDPPADRSWAFENISEVHLRPRDQAVGFQGDLGVYVTPWNSLNVVGLDAAGRLNVAWTTPDQTKWVSSDLTAATGLTPTAGLSAAVTPWGTIHVAGADAAGRVLSTWWSRQTGWNTEDLTAATGGPLLANAGVASYGTAWGGLNIAGLDRDTGDVVQYWWSPERKRSLAEAGREDRWGVAVLSVDAGEGAPTVQRIIGGAATPGFDASMNVFAADASGEIVRFAWRPNAVWGAANLTRDAQTNWGAARVQSISPANGESLVNLTRETLVRFNEPVVADTVTSDSLYVIANGQKVPGTLRVSRDERSVLFFYDNPLPASTEVRVVVDGTIMGRDGIVLDANGDLQPGGSTNADFSTLPITRLPGTEVFGYVYDSYRTNPDGSNIPVEGATITIDALPDVSAVTDANGFFELIDVPAPEFFVTIDGSTAVNAPDDTAYATLGKPFHSVPGQRVQLGKGGMTFDIFLPPMAGGDIVALPADQDTDVGFGPAALAQLAQILPGVDRAMLEAVRVTYPAGSAMTETGEAATRATIIPVDPDRLPAPLPGFVDPGLVISVQAGTEDGFNRAGGSTNFDVPAPLAFPNTEGLAPGEKSLLWSFDHDAGRWIVAGTGTVSADGMVIESDPGVGILAPGWHFTDPGVEAEGESDDEMEGYDPCAPGSPHRRLLDEQYDPRVQDALDDQAMVIDGETYPRLQPLGDVRSDLWTPWANYDEYSITLPESLIQAEGFVNAEEYLATWPDDMNNVGRGEGRDSFISINSFDTSTGRDVGDIILIDIPTGTPLVELADVMIVERGETSFRAATLTTYRGIFGVNRHPVSGSREWGFVRDGGNVTFYTRGMDSPDDPLVQLLGTGAQQEGWTSMMQGIGERFGLSPTEAREAVRGIGGSDTNFTGSLDAAPDCHVPPGGSQDPAHADDIGATPSDRDERQVYYRILYRLPGSDAYAPQELFGRSDVDGGFSATLPVRASYTIHTYNPTTHAYGVEHGVLGSDPRASLPTVHTSMRPGDDMDADGVPDMGEFVLGTAPDNADTDGDGIPDGAEIDQGLDPLGGRGFPTGLIASLPLLGDAQALDVQDDTIYVATDSAGLAIVDASQFDIPIIQGQVDLPGRASDVGVDPLLQLAAVATGSSLQIVDVSDAMTPRIVYGVGVPAEHVEVYDGVAYVASGNGLRAVDLGTGAILQSLALPGSGSVTSMARERGVLYAFQGGSDTLVSIDVSRIGEAAILDSLSVSIASRDVGVFAGNGTVWLAGSGLTTIDASDPAALSTIQTAETFFSARGVALNGSGLGLLAPDGGSTVQLYNTSDPTDTDAFVTEFDLSGAARAVAISRGIGYVAAGDRLEVINYRGFDAMGQAPNVNATIELPDVDPVAEGVQLVEGSRVPVRVDVDDDVQSARVELLVNGEVVASDVAFPFDFAPLVPPLADGGGEMRIVARAIDTGGNVGLSEEILVQVVPDTFAPMLLSTVPEDGGIVFNGERTLRLRFNEVLEDTSTDGLTIIGAGPDGQLNTADDVEVASTARFRERGQMIELVASFDVFGLHAIRIDQPAVRDVAGNALGDMVSQIAFDVQEATTILTGPDVVFMLDVSGSTSSPFGGTSVGDINGDGSFSDILDAQLAGLLALTQEIINLGQATGVRIAIVPFGSQGVIADMDPTETGEATSASPLDDRDRDGVRDVDQILGSITRGYGGAGGGTNFRLALQSAIGAFDAMGTTPGDGNIIFLSDGSGGGGFDAELAELDSRGVNLRAFGVGEGASLDLLRIMDPQATRFTSTDQLLDLFLGLA
ncbi:MAG: Ig-like domain-containing protein [Phycisphaerales bacterium JB060]